MTGTWINIGAVLVGGTVGLALGPRLPEGMRRTVIAGLGLFTAAVGIRLFLQTSNSIYPLGALLVGGLIGEWWRIEDRLAGFGRWIEERVQPRETTFQGQSLFVRGFLTASLVFCVGPMTILGSIQDGLTGDYSLLAIKAAMDGFAAMAFASTLGMGVLFSVLVILAYQGGLSLLAAQAKAVLTAPLVSEMTAVGGILLLGIAVSSLLEVRPIRTANFLPALVLAPLLVWLAERLGPA